RADHDTGTWGSAINFNHSLAGVCNRWLSKDYTWQNGELTISERVGRPDSMTLRVGVAGGGMVFLLAALLASRRRPFGIGEVTRALTGAGDAAGLPSRDSLEYGLVM